MSKKYFYRVWMPNGKWSDWVECSYEAYKDAENHRWWQVKEEPQE